MCKQNLSAESPRTGSHLPIFKSSAAFFIPVFSGTDHKRVRNQWTLTPSCTNICRFAARFVTHFLNAFQSLSGCDTQTFPSLFLTHKPKWQQRGEVGPGGTKLILLPLLPSGTKSCSCSQDSGGSSVCWASVFKAYKHPHGKIPLHVETETVHTTKEDFP